MADYVDFEGKTTQEALDLAVEKTGLSPSNLKFEIVNPGGGGIFGISFKKAKIRVFLEEEKKDKEPPRAAPEKTRTRKPRQEKAPEPEKAEPGRQDSAAQSQAAPEQEEPETKAQAEVAEKDQPKDEPPRSTWARPTKKATLPKKEKKVLTRDDLIKPPIPKDRIDVDLRDERDIRRAERFKKKRERDDRGRGERTRDDRGRGERVQEDRPAREPRQRQERIKVPASRDAAINEPPQDIGEEHKEMAAESLREVLAFWLEEATVESDWREGKIYLNILGDGSGLLIGRKGQTLDAIQFIVGKIVDKKAGKHLRLMVDTENYRKRREQSLERTAIQLAEKALSSRKGQTTGPMNPHDRRIIHLTLQEDGRFKTRSRGEGTYKRVLISLK